MMAYGDFISAEILGSEYQITVRPGNVVHYLSSFINAKAVIHSAFDGVVCTK